MARRLSASASAPAALGLAVALGGSACARRAVPYHFRAPLVGAVGGDGLRTTLPADGPAEPSRPGRPEVAPPITPAAIELAEAPPRRLELARPRPAAPPALSTRRDDRPPAGSMPAPDDLAGRLREQVGRRRGDDSLAFALAMLVDRAGPDGFEPAIAALATPSELAALADERGADLGARAPAAGDLLVFGPLGAPSALVAVAVATRPDGTTEFVALAGGVVRRGFVNPHRASTARDPDDGRALNTIVRWARAGGARGEPVLAGQLLVRRVALARLIDASPREPARLAELR